MSTSSSRSLPEASERFLVDLDLRRLAQAGDERLLRGRFLLPTQAPHHLGPQLLRGGRGGGTFLEQLEHVEAVRAGDDLADLAGLQSEAHLAEGGRHLVPGEKAQVAAFLPVRREGGLPGEVLEGL